MMIDRLRDVADELEPIDPLVPGRDVTRRQLLVRDALGKLDAHGHGLCGYCSACDRHSKVPMPVLIAARGADSPVVGMRPVTCAGSGGRETEIRITAPGKSGV